MTDDRCTRTTGHFVPDDTAVLPVLEAIMASMILMGAILFVTVTSNPVRDVGASGINLGTIAADTLEVLQGQPGLDDANITRLDEIIGFAMEGNTAQAETFLAGVVPTGTRYALRIDNGVEALQLLPAGSSATTPRSAAGAATYIMPNWTAHSSYSVSYTLQEELDFSSWPSNVTLSAPDGSTVGPGGVAWMDIWVAEEPAMDRVPGALPYGVWSCNAPCNDFRIVLDDGTFVARPLYSIELLLWDGV